MSKLRKQILTHCFDSYDDVFASGARANNKLDLEHIANIPRLRQKVVKALAPIVLPLQPNLVVATPNGANWLAEDLAVAACSRALTLYKDPDTKEFSYKSPDDEFLVLAARRVVVADDVLNNLTNTGKVLALPGIEERTQAILGIWDRNPGREAAPNIPIHALVREAIPAMLPEDSPLWRFAS